MAAWPSTLPKPLIANYTEKRQVATVRSEVDNGPPKVRRRFTAALVTVEFNLTLTSADVTTLETFYVTTVAEGSLPFTWTHPRTGATVNARFKEPYELTRPDALFVAKIALEILP